MTTTLSRLRRATVACGVTATLLGAAGAATGAVTLPAISAAAATSTHAKAPTQHEAAAKTRQLPGGSLGHPADAGSERALNRQHDGRVTRAAGRS